MNLSPYCLSFFLVLMIGNNDLLAIELEYSTAHRISGFLIVGTHSTVSILAWATNLCPILGNKTDMAGVDIPYVIVGVYLKDAIGGYERRLHVFPQVLVSLDPLVLPHRAPEGHATLRLLQSLRAPSGTLARYGWVHG
mmetsp:Transcript_42452/g.108633  ORF Transcript_42452/g.108633 Transcript_42452/m.108633 type:complete len:138 (-) Transcript_42452:313-726(-)